jgi:mRNA interferase MazF
MKDFDSWNEFKKKVHSKEKFSLCSEREIWWTSLGLNVGNEQDGTGNDYERPVVILKNINNTTCFIIPLTTSPIDNPYRIPLGKIKGKNAWAAISQLRAIDTKRLHNRVGKINTELFKEIKKALKEIL